MQYLSIKLSKSFVNAIQDYQVYKNTSAEETLHYISKIEKIRKQLIKIATEKKHLSKKVQYRNSKQLQYFIIEQHVVFFKITTTQLQVKYFVAVKRIKNLGSIRLRPTLLRDEWHRFDTRLYRIS